jgi:hypothetical protein
MIPGMATTGTTAGGGSLLVASTQNDSSVIKSEEAAGGGGNTNTKCYVCLPPDKSSAEAEKILQLFPGQSSIIPDCASIPWSNRMSSEFTCPPGYPGCYTRSHGESHS